MTTEAEHSMRFGAEALAWVGQNAERVESAKFDLAVSVVKAHEQGNSLRDISQAAGMSHESVRRLIHTKERT